MSRILQEFTKLKDRIFGIKAEEYNQSLVRSASKGTWLIQSSGVTTAEPTLKDLRREVLILRGKGYTHLSIEQVLDYIDG